MTFSARLCFVLGVLVGGPLYAQGPLPGVVGTISGSFEVSLSGSATYSIPIRVPPGAAGTEPKISLNYDSQGPAGPLGAGWSIGGISAITRGPKTLYVDGRVDGVSLADSDALFVDGQRLVAILRQGTGSNTRVEYRKEIDDQTQITQIGVGLDTAKFVVKTKGGLRLLFDGANDSRVTIGSNKTLLLSVSRILDTVGNFIEFQYGKNGHGDYDIKAIRYTGLGSIDDTGNFTRLQDPFAQIVFTYAAPPRALESYVAGALARRQSKLLSIESSISTSSMTETLARYVFEYDDRSTTPSRFVLSKIRQFGGDGSQIAPTEFKYSEPKVLWNEAKFSLPLGVAYALRDKLAGGYRFAKFSQSASPLPDLLVAADIDGKLETFAFENSAGVFKELDAKFRPPFAFVDSDGADLGALILDLDGDGKADLLQSNKDKNGVVTSKAFLAAADGWPEAKNYALPFELSQAGKRVTEIVLGKPSANAGPDLLFQSATDSGFLRNGGKATGWQLIPMLKPPVRIDRFAKLLDLDCDDKLELVAIDVDASAPKGWRWRVFRSDVNGWVEDVASKFIPTLDPAIDPEGIRVVRFLPSAIPQGGASCAGLIASTGSYRAAIASNADGWVSVKSEFAPPFDLVLASGDATNARTVDLYNRGVDDVIAHQLDSAGHPIRFAFEQATTGWQPSPALPPLLGSLQKGALEFHAYIGDLSGDGFPEIVLPAGLRGEPTRVFVGSASGFSPAPDFVPSAPFARADVQDRGIRFVDLNGDGLPDILFHREISQPKANDFFKGAFINTGRGWMEAPGLIPEVPFAGEKISGNPVQFVDVDGDGFVDMLYSYRRRDGSTRRAYFRNEACAVSGEEALCGPHNPNDPIRRRKWVEQVASPLMPPAGIPFSAESVGDLGVRVVDLNGDGRPDLVSSIMPPVSGSIELCPPPTTPGGPQPPCEVDPTHIQASAWINDGSAWVAASGYKPPLPFVMQETGTGDRTADTFVQLVDLDGDRLPDLIASFTHPRSLMKPLIFTYRNTGVGWSLDETLKAPVALDAGVKSPKTTTQWMDLNGDGLLDIVVSHRIGGGNLSATYLSTGRGFIHRPEWQVPTAAIADHHGDPSFRLIDINGDGLLDIVYARKLNGGAIERGVFVNNGSGFVADPDIAADPKLIEKIPPFIDEKGYDQGVRIVDVDGNGLVDIIQAFASGPSYALPTGPVLINAGRRSDVLSSVHAGYKLVTEVTYRTLLEEADATAGSVPWARIYHPGVPAAHPIINPIPASYVVARVLVDEGDGRSGTLHYRYGEFRIHSQAMHPLGFGWRESFNERSRALSRTELEQDVKLRNSPKREATCLIVIGNLPATPAVFGDSAPRNLCPAGMPSSLPPWAKKLSESATDWRMREQTVSGAGIPTLRFRQINLAKSETSTFEYADGGVLLKQTDSFIYDEPTDLLQRRLNLVESLTERGDGTSILTKNEYLTDDTRRWHLGRLRKSTVIKTGDVRPDGSGLRKAEVKAATFEYDRDTGLLLAETANAHFSTKAIRTLYERDGRGNITGSTTTAPGELPVVKRTEFDALGRFATAEINPAGHRISRTLRPTDGLPITELNQNGLLSKYDYDGFGRRIRQTSPGGIVTDYSLMDPSQLPDASLIVGLASAATIFKTQTAGMPASFQVFDNKGRELRNIQHAFKASAKSISLAFRDTSYDLLGRADRTSLPYLAGAQPSWAVVEFDAIGRIVKATSPSGDTVTTSFQSRHGGGAIVSMTNQLGHRSTVEKNQRGLPIVSTDGMNQSVKYEYDAGDRLEALTGPTGARTLHTYDDVGQRIRTSDPDLGIWSYKYDAFGRIVRQTDAKDQVTSIEYDSLSRPVRKVQNDATSLWTYDVGAYGVGKVTAVQNSDGYREDYVYDQLGRLGRTAVTINAEVFVTSVEYDQLGRVSRTYFPTGFSVYNVYDHNGFLIAVNDARTNTPYWSAVSIDEQGRLTGEKYGNGVSTQRHYEAKTGFLRKVEVSSTQGTKVLDLALQFDQVGSLIKREEFVEKISERFEYDPLDRLVAMVGDGKRSEYKFLADGRFESKTDVGKFEYPSNTTRGPFHAVLSTVAASKSSSYSYDENGNMTKGPLATFEYTADNRVNIIFANQHRWVQFSYSPNGSRYRQFTRVGTEVTEVLYVGRYERLTEFVGPLTDARRGRVVRHRYALSNGMSIFATVEANNVYADVTKSDPVPKIVSLTTQSINHTTKVWYLHRDQLGSIVRITDEGGHLSGKYWYDPWGKRTGGPVDLKKPVGAHKLDSTWDRGFTGHEHLDEYSLVHMNGRMYESTIANFTSVDLINQSNGDTQTGNGYQYANRNPLKYTDPTGYFSFGGFVRGVIGGAVGFLIGGPAGAVAGFLYATSPDVKKFVDENWRTAVIIGVTIAVGIVTGPGGALAMNAILAGAVVGATSAAVATALYGGSIDETLQAAARGAVFGAASGALFSAAGTAFDGSAAALGSPDSVGAMAAHGVAGGVMESANGGNFWQGFAAASFTKGASSYGPQFYGPNALAANTLRSALVGGTAAALCNGNFVNGAATGAFSYLFNEARHVSTREGLQHYLEGSGEALTIPVAQMDELYGDGWALGSGQIRNSIMSGDGDYMINDKFSYTSTKNANLLNQIDARISGRLHVKSGVYAFSGRVSWGPDLYNMNQSTHRGGWGEFKTSVGRIIGETFGSKPYRIHVEGTAPASARGYVGP